MKVGLNLETPGTSSLRANKLVKSVEARPLWLAEVDMNARHVIDLASKVGMADDSVAERAVESESIPAPACQVAEEGIVLPKNDDATLPIPKGTRMRIAVFGVPATEPIIHRGASSSLSPHYIITPLKPCGGHTRTLNSVTESHILGRFPVHQ